MIALDTNILIRFFIADNAEQHRRAKEIMLSNNRFFIAKSILLETAWVLKRAYRIDRAEICLKLRSLCAQPHFEIEDFDVILVALNLFEQGLDFGDSLHLATALDYNESQIEKFLTFDKKFMTKANSLDLHLSLQEP